MSFNTLGCRSVLLFSHDLCPTILVHISFRRYLAAEGKVCLGLDVGLYYVALELAKCNEACLAYVGSPDTGTTQRRIGRWILEVLLRSCNCQRL